MGIASTRDFLKETRRVSGLETKLQTLNQRILVVDDEVNLRRSMLLILQRTGYMVDAVGSVEEARQSLKEHSYDLVFLDLKMPGISGHEFLPELRNCYPDLPVLILTAHASLESAIEAVRRGARDYLLKPIDPELIIGRIKQLLSDEDPPRRRQELVKGMRNLLSELTKLEGYAEAPANEIDDIPVGDPARYLQRGPFNLDLHTQQAYLAGKPLSISPTAFNYLVTLVRHSPNVIPCENLVAESQGYRTSAVEAKEMARWRVHELRRAIEPNSKHPNHIITVRGTGYRLVL